MTTIKEVHDAKIEGTKAKDKPKTKPKVETKAKANAKAKAIGEIVKAVVKNPLRKLVQVGVVLLLLTFAIFLFKSLYPEVERTIANTLSFGDIATFQSHGLTVSEPIDLEKDLQEEIRRSRHAYWG